MPPLSAQETAHRLLARAPGAGRAPPEALATAHQVLRRLVHELAAWFGPFGARALLARALTHAQAAHSALAAVRVAEAPAPDLDGLDNSARAHGGDAVAMGMADVITEMVALLGRLIGDDLTATLIEQSLRAPAIDAVGDAEGRATANRSTTGAAAAGGDTPGSTRHD